MSIRSIWFLFREAFTNIWRHQLMTLASVTTVSAALSVLGGFLLVGWQLHKVAESLPRQIEVHVFMQVRTPREKVLELQSRILGMPGVKTCKLITKEEAWQTYIRDYPEKKDLDGIRENPLPDKLEIRTRNPAATTMLSRRLHQQVAFPEIDTIREGGAVLEKLISVARLVRIIGLSCAGLLLLATVAVIANAIRVTVFARRREIRIMQLVGATQGFIRLPFLIEGMFDGAIGALFACGLLLVGYRALVQTAFKTAPFLRALHVSVELPQFFAALLTLGVLIGMLGSFVSIRRFLNATA
jgi:cell division transport system permease protein